MDTVFALIFRLLGWASDLTLTNLKLLIIKSGREENNFARKIYYINNERGCE